MINGMNWETEWMEREIAENGEECAKIRKWKGLRRNRNGLKKAKIDDKNRYRID